MKSVTLNPFETATTVIESSITDFTTCAFIPDENGNKNKNRQILSNMGAIILVTAMV